MEAYLESIEADFSLSKQKLKELTEIFQSEVEIGLAKSDGMLRALPTFVFDLPKGSEVGKFLTVDLGGTNLRIGLVELLGSGQFTIKKDSAVIPDELKSGSGKAIFEFIAQNIEIFLKHPEIEAEMPLKLGFTFSFPIQQESLKHGRILGWSKEIEGRDVIGMDAVALLQEALHARGLDIQVEALVNDTVGTLLAQIYRDDRTKMGVILGTGSNAAYVEQCSQIPKLEDKNHGHTVINIEWGSFGDGDGIEILPMTRFDRSLDLESKNCGKQRYEKMISGMYLGEIFRLILVEAVEKGILKKSLEVIHKPYGIKTKEMSKFHSEFINGNIENCKEIIKVKFGIEIQSDSEIENISKLCEIISLRSCYLCAVGITAVHRHLLQSQSQSQLQSSSTSSLFSVALDGALYQRYPNYSTILQDLVCEMDKDDNNSASCRVVLVMAEDLSSVGAAAAIAAQK